MLLTLKNRSYFGWHCECWIVMFQCSIVEGEVSVEGNLQVSSEHLTQAFQNCYSIFHLIAWLSGQFVDYVWWEWFDSISVSCNIWWILELVTEHQRSMTVHKAPWLLIPHLMTHWHRQGSTGTSSSLMTRGQEAEGMAARSAGFVFSPGNILMTICVKMCSHALW